ncbi:hypothetical protein CHS0354_026116 [Potamilus streckersoni]|uniref:Uncharacterized protein n=1 Tax=Potamilus streckersoni TaxID=2493646 RepID=A0AAE0VNM9_9BIVA|nr:hypothetical protein CHS0354_026116 [Potamilus streckersoni]
MGGAQEPPPIRGNLGDEVERIRVFRNSVYGHAKEGHVHTLDYSDLCREMKTFVTSLDAFFGGNCDFVGRINSILTSSMDKALQDTYIDKIQEIAKLSDEMSKVKQIVGRIEKYIRDHHRQVVETTSQRRKTESSLKRGLKTLEGRVESLEKDSSQRILQQHMSHARRNFVETRAYIRANEILQQHRRLIITGKSGQEKNEFAKIYLKEYALSDAEVSTICKTGEATVGFSQICKADDQSRLLVLFSKLEQINHFRLEDNMTYGCLVLVLLSKGRLRLQSIRERFQMTVKRRKT